MVLNKCKFLKCKVTFNLKYPLKTYSDTLLFYYLGILALQNSNGNLFEIGLGGSSNVLYELSENFERTVTLCDMNPNALVNHKPCFSNANIEFIIDDSKFLHNKTLDPLAYVHIDGDKNFNVTYSDCLFALQNLQSNGIICQDDFGNNKFPTVTQAIYKLIEQEKAKIIVMGDNSIWITRPEFYDFWMNLLNNDYEFNLLKDYIGIQEATILGSNFNYYFLNLMTFDDNIHDRYTKNKFTQDELNYFQSLNAFKQDSSFLTMPYKGISTPGFWLN